VTPTTRIAITLRPLHLDLVKVLPVLLIDQHRTPSTSRPRWHVSTIAWLVHLTAITRVVKVSAGRRASVLRGLHEVRRELRIRVEKRLLRIDLGEGDIDALKTGMLVSILLVSKIQKEKVHVRQQS